MEEEGDQIKQSKKQFSFIVKDNKVKAYMDGQTAKFQIENIINCQFFQFSLTQQIHHQLPLESYFEYPSEVLDYLANSGKIININNDGVIQFQIELPNKKIKKLSIQTVKKVVDINQMLLRQLKNLQKQVKEQRKQMQIQREEKVEQNKEMLLQKRMNERQQIEIQKQNLLIKEIKDELIKSNDFTFQLNQSLQQLRKDVMKINQFFFYVDTDNSHFSEFSLNGRFIKKTGADSTFQTIFGKQILKDSIYSYRVLQVKSLNREIMYGAGSYQIRGKNNSYGTGYFVGYYAVNGCIYSGGSEGVSTGGAIKDQETIQIIIDLKSWRIFWKRNHCQVGSAVIPEKMRGQAIFPVVYLYNVSDEIEFV